MKKLATVLILTGHIPFAFAGGILTNTNQSVHFVRNMARNASTQIDAAYYNPAGLVKLNDGFHFSFTNQSAFQTRTITTTYLPLAGFGGNQTKEFEGTASAPIIPSLQAAYKTGNWVLSENVAVVGGGGKATFNRGLPSFESGIALLPGIVNQFAAGMGIPSAMLSAQGYSVDQYMRGSSFIYGAQLGGSYAFNDMFSGYVGFRLNIVNNKYEGHLKDLKIGLTSNGLESIGVPIPDNNGALVSPAGILDMAIAASDPATAESLQLLRKASGDEAYLNSSQSGWGVAPILGVNFSYDKLNIGAKYEFKASLNVENKTKIDDTGQFGDGVNTAHDIPALLSIGASYEILPSLSASIGYHRFFDSDAKMDYDKQKHISGGTNEYLAGVEYRINRLFLVSVGGQITRYGVKDDYQTDLSFSINSYSIGFGGDVNVSKNVMINIGYFWTTYSDWTKEKSTYSASLPGVAGTDVFSRTNKVFAAGVDFSF